MKSKIEEIISRIGIRHDDGEPDVMKKMSDQVLLSYLSRWLRNVDFLHGAYGYWEYRLARYVEQHLLIQAHYDPKEWEVSVRLEPIIYLRKKYAKSKTTGTNVPKKEKKQKV